MKLIASIFLTMLATGINVVFADSSSDDTDLWPEIWENSAEDTTPQSPWRIGQFLDIGIGGFTRNNLTVHDLALAEVRYQFSANRHWGNWLFASKLETLVDDLASPETDLKVRELFVSGPLGPSVDIRFGRQVLTWGTGDLLFLNDLFSKDWQAFFSGREITYLKGSTNALKVSLYSTVVNLDLVWVPEFDADNSLTGERFSFYSPIADSQVAAPPVMPVRQRDRNLSDNETHLRLYRQVKGTEFAFYGYHGFYKQPLGWDATTNEAFHPRLNAAGVSIRGTVGKGIVNAEWVYWDSVDENSHAAMTIPSSEQFLLLGYEQEIAKRLTLGVQYLGRFVMHQNAMSPNGDRHWLTTRLSWRSASDKLTLSVFNYYSPDENDGYLLPKVHYRMDDHWRFESGINYFWGEKQSTFWGQLDLNSNIYFRMRYQF